MKVLPGAAMRERTATPHRTARFDWDDGASRAVFGFDAKAPGKSVVSGDVHPDVAEVAGFLSPNPGGVGPMTVALLMTNVVEAAERL